MKDLFKKVFFNIIPKAFLIACLVDIIFGVMLGILFPHDTAGFTGIFLLIFMMLLALASVLLFLIIVTTEIVSLKNDSISKNKLILLKLGIILLIYFTTFCTSPFALLTLMVPVTVTMSLREKVVSTFNNRAKKVNNPSIKIELPQEEKPFYQETMPEMKKVAPKELPKTVIKNEDVEFEVNLGRCRMITSRWNPPYVDEVHNTTLEVRIASSGRYNIILKESSGNKEFDDSTMAPTQSMINEIAKSIPWGQTGHTFLTFTSCPRFKVVTSDLN